MSGNVKEALAKAQAVKAVEELDMAERARSLAGQILNMTSEEITKEADLAKTRKTAAQQKARELYEIQQALEKIYDVPDWELSERLRTAAEKLVARMEELGDSDDVKLALLVHRVKASPLDEASVRKAFASVAAIGRGQLASSEEIWDMNDGKYPSTAVVFEDLCLLAIASAYVPDGQQSKADHYLFEALRRLVGRHYRAEKRAREKAAQEKMAMLASQAGVERNLSRFLDGNAALYQFGKPERTVNGKKIPAGVALFKMEHDHGGRKQVGVTAAAGSLEKLEQIRGYQIRFLHLEDLWKAYANRKRDNFRRFDELLDRQSLPRHVKSEDEEGFRKSLRRFVEELYFATLELRKEQNLKDRAVKIA